MNYGIFKNGRFLSGDNDNEDRPPVPRRKPTGKRPRRRRGCVTLVLPVMILILYLILKSKP
ncbi:MAG: hypothetical protein ACERKO_11625 [Acetanaerobacterium sp.]